MPNPLPVPTPAMYSRLARKMLGPTKSKKRRERRRRRKRRRNKPAAPWKSYGIALFRGARAAEDPRNRIIQVLLVRHRCSYAFNDFVYGHFSGRLGAADLYRRMSRGERILAVSAANSGDHSEAWAQMLIDDPVAEAANARRWHVAWGRGRESAGAARKRFVKQWRGQRNTRQGTFSCPAPSPPRWGLPKGRPRAGEPGVVAAFRELWEETRVRRSSVVAINSVGTRSVSTEATAKNRGAPVRRYLDIYRPGIAIGPVGTGPTSAGDHVQRSEIMETRWVQVSWKGGESEELDELCDPEVAKAVRELAEATAANAASLLWTSLSTACDLDMG